MILAAEEHANIILFIESRMGKTGEFALFEELVAKYPEINDNVLASIYRNRLSQKACISMRIVKENLSNILEEYKRITSQDATEVSHNTETRNALEVSIEPQNVTEVSIEPQNVTEVSIEPQNVTEVSIEPQNVTEVSIEPQNVTEVSIEPQNVTEVSIEPQNVTEVSIEPQNVTEVSIEPQNVTEVSIEPQNVTEVSIEPQNVTEISIEPQNVTEVSIEPQKALEVVREPKNVSEGPREPLNATEDSIGPKNVTEVSIEPQNVTEVSIEPQNVTEISIEPQNVTEVSIEPQKALEVVKEPKNVTEDPREPLNATEDSIGPKNSTEGSIESQNATEDLIVPEDATEELIGPQHATEDFLELQNETGIFIKLAKKYDVSALMIARPIIENFLEKEQAEMTPKDFAKLVAEHIKDPSLITDGQLAHEVFLAACCDFNNSPLANASCLLTGISHELKLHAFLKNLGISFKTEHQLRELKYEKTPDVILDVGIFVDCQVVKWIESKARFADDSMHAAYLETQYNEYYSRYGPGLIIYWFGYVDTIKNVRRRFVISDGLPKKVVTLFDF